MNTMILRVLYVSLMSAATLSFPSAGAQEITGAGASFPAPIYSKWASEYFRTTGVKVNYQSIGSSGGIKQIDSKTVDFGATDAPLRDEELQKKGQIQFPTLVGGVVPIVNLKGVKPGELRLSGQVLGDIYLGKITRWNDASIQTLNPELTLPDAAIAPVRRADGSGTSFLFTSFLSRTNKEWRDKVGEGTTVNWPVGTGGKGNEGVALYVHRLPYSIGYVEYAYVKQNRLNYAQLLNQAGAFVSPSISSFRAAASNVDWSKSLQHILTNQPGAETWPITGATFILMQARPDNTPNAQEAVKFFRWAYNNGAKAATDLDYVAMPSEVIAQVERLWTELKDPSGNSLVTR